MTDSRERPLRSSVRFKVARRNLPYYTPFDTPLGGPLKQPPSRFDVLVGDIENGYLALPFLTWVHLVGIAIAGLLILDYHEPTVLILALGVIVGLLTSFLADRRTSSDAARREATVGENPRVGLGDDARLRQAPR